MRPKTLFLTLFLSLLAAQGLWGQTRTVTGTVRDVRQEPIVGAGILIEKVFQGGGDRLRAEGLRIESLAKIASMSDDSLVFCD